MLNVTGIRVKNLRSLRDTGWIDIRPITILVGRNSSGKSSFARVFPLLKQSSERQKRSPLLWYGRLVDFGSFEDAVSSFAEPRHIELCIRFSTSESLVLNRYLYSRNVKNSAPNAGNIDASLTLVEGEDGRTDVQRLSLDIFGVQIVATNPGTQDSSLLVNGEEYSIPNGSRLSWNQGVVLPQPRYIREEVDHINQVISRRAIRLGEDVIKSAVASFVHGNTLEETKLEIADKLPVSSLDELLRFAANIGDVPESWKSSFKYLHPSSHRLQTLQRTLAIYKLEPLLAALDEALSEFCARVSYLEPLRATAQRYYRREEVSVEELDPKGFNTAFFVQSLTARQKESLSSWLQSSFGFRLGVRNDRGHVSMVIEVDDSGGAQRNMADVGLGYSQLAPVAIQLWAARFGGRKRLPVQRYYSRSASTYPSNFLVIEQPELHLHPAFQSKLADIFVASCTVDQDESARAVRIMAETHSPNLIGRLGELVRERAISSSDISILLFEPDEHVPSASKVRIAQFDDEGILTNWPVGFFDY